MDEKQYVTDRCSHECRMSSRQRAWDGMYSFPALHILLTANTDESSTFTETMPWRMCGGVYLTGWELHVSSMDV